MHNRTRNVRRVAFGAIFAMLGMGIAQAASINYGNHPGDTVVYQQVTESSVTDPVPLYGPPLVVDDSLVFSPTSFFAFAMNGSVDLTDALLSAVIQAQEGHAIHTVLVSEAGTFDLGAVLLPQASVSVGAAVFVKVLEVDGQPITPFTIADNLVFTPPGGAYALPADYGYGQPWSGFLSMDIDAALASRDISGSATKITFAMNNTLTAISQGFIGDFGAAQEFDSYARIEKNEVIIGINTIVPEPAGLSVLGAGLLLLMRRCRR